MEDRYDLKIRARYARRVISIGLVCNLLLMIFKLTVGLWGKSSALVADAVNSLSDSITDAVALIGFCITGKPHDATHDFGHAKFETLSTLVIGIFLIAAAGFILWNSIGKIISVAGGVSIEKISVITLIPAAFTMGVKELLYVYTNGMAKKLDSSTLKLKAWDHRSDVFLAGGTFLGIAGAVLLGEKWRVLDPITAAILGMVILRLAIPLAMESINELLEASLPEQEEKDILDIIWNIPDVRGIHDLKTRRLGPHIAVSVHIMLEGGMTLNRAHDITVQLERDFKRRFGPHSIITIHMEPADSRRLSKSYPKPEEKES
ncbi:cation diffusion facilitator family transporter [Acetomicrobium thermoterrenum DSM 13490]|jgi:cation diffusion facilitator family transporter|uniref:Cation diffusion facilitator family transporter n=1 Tax=Acetomicrobium thermoterrenum DSM 13490 TaxID=1120987 RepID=A0A1H3GEP4_9BACT|nr:cation diffusion facilitator family transporter [Acetomicrobium thermoterrenum]SDY01793.1 cation diffusion facilitator family transporter [Acetomicrobium thermoterrenum DSM 13490]